MSENSSGRAAYEAYYAAVADVLLPPWDELTGAEHRAWDAAAQAATATHSLSGTGALMGDIIALRATRDEYRDNAILHIRERDALAAENTRLQALVRQALDDAGVPEDVQAEWLERAGLDG